MTINFKGLWSAFTARVALLLTEIALLAWILMVALGAQESLPNISYLESAAISVWAIFFTRIFDDIVKIERESND